MLEKNVEQRNRGKKNGEQIRFFVRSNIIYMDAQNTFFRDINPKKEKLQILVQLAAKVWLMYVQLLIVYGGITHYNV